MYGIQTDEFSEHWAPSAVAALRIVTALLFLEHATAKLFAFPLTAAANPPMWSLFWIAGIPMSGVTRLPAANAPASTRNRIPAPGSGQVDQDRHDIVRRDPRIAAD